MKENKNKKVCNLLAKASVQIGMGTLESTTRFYLHQPASDYEIYLKAKEKGLLDRHSK